MFLSLLVPLDRSSLAEQALPLALSIARRAHARLDLVQVHALDGIEDRHAGWTPFAPAVDDKCKQQEQLYLDATATWLTSVSPVSASTAVLPGLAVIPAVVADNIVEHARVSKADLIVMTTHGRGALGRMALGSVADALIRRADMPVLLVRPSDKAPAIVPEPVLDDILVPLDGSTLAEQVLAPVLDLARLMEARCTLLRVIESRSSSDNVGLSERAPAEAYLERVARRLREQGLEVRTLIVVARHAAQAILQEALRQGNNLIALATHGRGGLKRLLMGSVADKLLREATTPILVYHPAGKAT
jgi:nucleotide-binding universal stress UspA family protein